MTRTKSRMPRVGRGCFPVLATALLVCLASVPAVAQVDIAGGSRQGAALDALHNTSHCPIYVVPLKPGVATLYATGEQVEAEFEARWRYMCGSDFSGLTVEHLAAIADAHYAALENGPVIIVDSGTRGAGIDIVFNTDGSVPAAALDGFAMAEAYLEDQFSDAITIEVSASFASMGGGVLGACSSNYRNNETWANSRDGLQNGMDGNDTLQNWLPSGSTIPVRYDGLSDFVSNETVIDWTVASYNATVGSVSGSAASMTYNIDVSWDYDPSDGVLFSKMSFVDVVVHETGHSLGFTSAVDFKLNQMEAMDIFRFQRSDGSFDYNPDTYEEFQTGTRLVDKNKPDDDHISDFIDVEYRMEDGNPNQASHWRQGDNLGIMAPMLSNGSTRYPNFFSTADAAMFDMLGYNYPPGSECVMFTTQPTPSQIVCEGDTVQLDVATEDEILMTFQWRIGTTDLVDDGSHIFGAATKTLMIFNFGAGDVASDYNCNVTNTFESCSFPSNDAEVLMDTHTPVITQQPQSQTVTEGDFVTITVEIEAPLFADYQWQKDGSPLSDNGHFFGTATETLNILPVELVDAGDYDCVLTSLLGELCSTTSDAATLTVNSAGDDCPEDLDDDGSVGLSDLAILLANFGQTSGMGPDDGDLDGDGDVDLSDLAELLAVYGQDCPTR